MPARCSSVPLMIQMRHISKRFGPVAALDDVSIDIPPGRVLGLLGENGAGKSTLMSILFGLVKPNSGSILVDAREVLIRSSYDPDAPHLKAFRPRCRAR